MGAEATNQVVMSRPEVGHYIALAISILFNAASLLMLKKTALSELTSDLSIRDLSVFLRVAINPLFILSVVLFAGGVFFWVYALSRIDLSLAYPTVSSSYVFIALASLVLFDEKIPPIRWIGMGIVIVGIVVMYRE